MPPTAAASGGWRGVVTRVDPNGTVHVRVPRLTGDRPDPALVCEHVGPLEQDDRVAVVFIEGRDSEPLVIGRLP